MTTPAAPAPVRAFVAALKRTPPGPLFNPWYERDPDNDAPEKDAPRIRREQLVHYLAARRGRARHLLIAEAVGYQGGHFSGVAMTSERILLGHVAGVRPRDVLPGLAPQRTSSPAACSGAAARRMGYAEPTATIVWTVLLADLGLDPLDFALWNAVPWHPCRANGMLTNRTPTGAERDAARPHLRAFLALYPAARPIAVGGVAHEMLASEFGPAPRVRHPANGGKAAFARQIAEIVRP